VTAVVGGDGAGKTTLLRCVAGALAPDDGTVRRPDAHRIGYLPTSAGVYDDLSVTENLEFRAAAYGLAPQEAARRTGEYLERTGLAPARDRLAGQLSGGMRRKLGVIAALMPDPELLVLDEPTTGVDPVSRADLWWLIARAAAGGASVLMATTYLDEASRASRVLVLDAGQPLAEGSPPEIVAAIPGTIAVLRERPEGDERRRTWRRAGAWRLWQPPPDPAQPPPPDPAQPPSADPGQPWPTIAPGAELVTPDLQDAVCVAALRRELALGHA
jgi:ABC-2 type transport system ATP-binding protein